MYTFILTSLALLAFAGNSVLCRLALSDDTIDAGSFTSIRLLSAVIVLFFLIQFNKQAKHSESKGSWRAAIALFVYAAGFSFAYLSLDTGVGALVLFGSVQATLILYQIFRGEKISRYEWLGLLLALSGFVILLLPDLSLPTLIGFILMMISGIAWAFYTLSGKVSKAPLCDTSFNFLRTLPFVIILMSFSVSIMSLTYTGVLLAIVSGGITSGLGYAIWYAALKNLTVVQSGVLQLLVPVVAAIGGVLFSNEIITLNLMISSVMVLGGILFVFLGKQRSISKN